MKHTPGQLQRMVDAELNNILKQKLFGYGWHTERALSKINYCIDWSATGPLMVKYGVAPLAEFGELRGATNNSYEYHEPHGSIVHSSENDNPLRAVVECLILVLQEDE